MLLETATLELGLVGCIGVHQTLLGREGISGRGISMCRVVRCDNKQCAEHGQSRGVWAEGLGRPGRTACAASQGSAGRTGLEAPPRESGSGLCPQGMSALSFAQPRAGEGLWARGSCELLINPVVPPVSCPSLPQFPHQSNRKNQDGR